MHLLRVKALLAIYFFVIITSSCKSFISYDYVIKPKQEGDTSKLLAIGIFVYREFNFPFIGKTYSITYPLPELVHFTTNCSLEDLKKEGICKTDSFLPRRKELVSKKGNVETYVSDRISISEKANFFLKQDKPLFNLVKSNDSEKLYVTYVGFSSGNSARYMNPYTFYQIQNPEAFPLQLSSNEDVQLIGIYAVKVERQWFSNSTIVDRVGFLEDGIEVMKKINDKELIERYCGKGELTRDNCLNFASEQIRKSLNPPYLILK